jgi:hypothetical protein
VGRLRRGEVSGVAAGRAWWAVVDVVVGGYGAVAEYVGGSAGVDLDVAAAAAEVVARSTVGGGATPGPTIVGAKDSNEAKEVPLAMRRPEVGTRNEFVGGARPGAVVSWPTARCSVGPGVRGGAVPTDELLAARAAAHGGVWAGGAGS